MNAHPIHRRNTTGLVKSFFAGLWYAMVSALAFAGLLTIVVGAWAVQTGWVPSLPDGLAVLRREGVVRVASSSDTTVLPRLIPFAAADQRDTKVVYLNREGGVLSAGVVNDATRNVSTVVAGASLSEHEIPAFRGTAARWDDIVECVQRQFAPYDVDIVAHRPVEGPYTMVMVGGQPGALAAASGNTTTRGARITGLAPLGARPIENAVVYAFSREMREATNDVCETIAHEIGHAFGLDHVLDCHDPMTHLPRCGRRSFQDRYTQCGEREARDCYNGQPGQSSHQYLLDLLGPRDESSEG